MSNGAQPRSRALTQPVFQGLIPWAWIEASTKGAVLLFVASEAEYYARTFGASPFVAGISGGMTGGLAQAYATMGFCTCMKTVEITKHKVAAVGQKPPGTMATFADIWRREGLRGINRGVNAVAVRQVTNWGSRFGLSRVAETGLRRATGKQHGEKLSAGEKIAASALGGGLSAWNQPIEVIRVEMQSKTPDPNRPKQLTVGKAAKYIYQTNGVKGLYRGVTPRICLGVWQTVCMVALGDMCVLSPRRRVPGRAADALQCQRSRREGHGRDGHGQALARRCLAASGNSSHLDGSNASVVLFGSPCPTTEAWTLAARLGADTGSVRPEHLLLAKPGQCSAHVLFFRRCIFPCTSYYPNFPVSYRLTRMVTASLYIPFNALGSTNVLPLQHACGPRNALQLGSRQALMASFARRAP